MNMVSGWPIIIVEDRYSGTYSGGRWVALADARDDLRVAGLLDMIWGDDCTAAEFSESRLQGVAVGDTPDEALQRLKDRLNKQGDWLPKPEKTFDQAMDSATMNLRSWLLVYAICVAVMLLAAHLTKGA